MVKSSRREPVSLIAAPAIADFHAPDNADSSDVHKNAAMEHVLFRFFTAVTEKKLPKPDILCIDGGKGQLKSARKALQAFDLDIKLLAVAKGDKRKTGEETLWAGWEHAPPKTSTGI